MNKAVGEEVSALIGKVSKFNCDDEGTAIG